MPTLASIAPGKHAPRILSVKAMASVNAKLSPSHSALRSPSLSLSARRLSLSARRLSLSARRRSLSRSVRSPCFCFHHPCALFRRRPRRGTAYVRRPRSFDAQRVTHWNGSRSGCVAANPTPARPVLDRNVHKAWSLALFTWHMQRAAFRARGGGCSGSKPKSREPPPESEEVDLEQVDMGETSLDQNEHPSSPSASRAAPSREILERAAAGGSSIANTMVL